LYPTLACIALEVAQAPSDRCERVFSATKQLEDSQAFSDAVFEDPEMPILQKE
jgi:hypothetical protein